MESANRTENIHDRKLKALYVIYIAASSYYAAVQTISLCFREYTALFFTISQPVLVLISLILYLLVFTHCYNRLPRSFTMSIWIPGIISAVVSSVQTRFVNSSFCLHDALIYITLAIPLIFTFKYLILELKVYRHLFSYSEAGSLKLILVLSALYLILVALYIYKHSIVINL